MLTDYITAAMHKAKYELLPDNEGYYGEIRACRGVWSNADDLETCRTELKSCLEDWLILRLRNGNSIPVIDRMNLNARRSRQKKVA